MSAPVGARRAIAVLPLAAMVVAVVAAPASAATRCALPAAFGLAIEERGVTERGGPGLFAAPDADPTSGLAAGDRLRQANGGRVERCADLERLAGEALAKGLALLLGIERDGTFTAIAAVSRPAESAVARGAVSAPPRDAGQKAPPPAAPARDEERARGPTAPRPTAAPPAAREEAPLPNGTDVDAGLRERAAAAAAALTTLDGATGTTVPLVVYERRLSETERAITAIDFGTDPAGRAVQRVVEDGLDYHRTALAIRRTVQRQLDDHRIDRRAPPPGGVPYFSDSAVPTWVASYPFLHASLRDPPRETRMLVTGEVAGHWDPDEALALLWERAGAVTARLGAWARS